MKQQDNILTFILCLILWSLIIFVFLFIIMVDKVFADTPTRIELYNNTTLLNTYNNTTNFTYTALQNSNKYSSLYIFYNKSVANSKHVYFSGYYRLNVSDFNVPKIRYNAWYIDSGGTWTSIVDSCTNSGTRRDVDPNAIFEQNITCVFDTTTAIQSIVVRYYFTDRTTNLYTMNGIIFNQISNVFSAESSEADNINANTDKNTNIIVNNNNENTESIINNQNNNTTQITEAIENQSKVCHDYRYDETTLPIEYTGTYLNNQGNTYNANNFDLSEYIPFSKDSVVSLDINYNTSVYYCLYNKDKVKQSCSVMQDFTWTATYDGYIRLSNRKGAGDTLLYIGEYCYNSNEKQVEEQEKTNQNLENINDSLTSTANPDIELPSDPFTFEGVEGIFLLPITIARSYNSTCTPYSFTLYNHIITFPCINLQTYLGSTVWGIIDAIFVFSITMGVVNLIRRVYISFTSLSDDVYLEYFGRPETYGDLAAYSRFHGGGSE